MKNKSIILFGLFIIVAIGLLGFLGYKIFCQTKSISDNNILSISKPKLTTTTKPITFMIGGNVMLGRAVAWKFNNDVTQAFTKLGQNYFGRNDIGIVNLEGPISTTEFQSNPNPDNLIFNFPPQSIDALKYLGINAVSSANNHSQNQGINGLEITRQLLLDNNIIDIGSQTSFNDLNIHEFGKLSIIAVNLVGEDFDVTDTIKSEKAKGQFVLVFPHWGSEYQTTHSASQSQYAYNWIDAGADIIIGSHPHVVQDGEIYNNKPIFYSLGNLVFDQPFSTETQRGLILKGEISDKEIKIEILPTKISGNQVELSSGSDMDSIIDKCKSQIGEQYFSNNLIIIPYK